VPAVVVPAVVVPAVVVPAVATLGLAPGPAAVVLPTRPAAPAAPVAVVETCSRYTSPFVSAHLD
jgi:hypothetical protein